MLSVKLFFASSHSSSLFYFLSKATLKVPHPLYDYKYLDERASLRNMFLVKNITSRNKPT